MAPVTRDVKKLKDPTSKPSLQGFGGQFDCELFIERRERSHAISPEERETLQHVVNRLKLGHSRIFASVEVLAHQNHRDALMDTIGMAQAAGANVNLTW